MERSYMGGVHTSEADLSSGGACGLRFTPVCKDQRPPPTPGMCWPPQVLVAGAVGTDRAVSGVGGGRDA